MADVCTDWVMPKMLQKLLLSRRIQWIENIPEHLGTGGLCEDVKEAKLSPLQKIDLPPKQKDLQWILRGG